MKNLDHHSACRAPKVALGSPSRLPCSLRHPYWGSACRASLRPPYWGSARQAGRPASTATHDRRTQMFSKKNWQKAMCFGHFALAIQQTLIYAGGGGSGGRGRGPQPPNVFALARLAFGPKIGVALAGLAGHPQLPPTSAAHKWFQKKTGKKLCVLDILRLPSKKR